MLKIIFTLFFIFTSSVFSLTIAQATASDLMEIKGVGKKTAQRIIEFRDSGNFNSVDDLIQVKGVGKAKLQRIKEYLNSSESESLDNSGEPNIDLSKYND
jgi:competence ComEA-like helix-hairpin-helix protein